MESALRHVLVSSGVALVLLAPVHAGDWTDHLQLVSSTVSDIFEQWTERDLTTLRGLLRRELQLASAIINNLIDAFSPRGRGGYKAVDAA